MNKDLASKVAILLQSIIINKNIDNALKDLENVVINYKNDTTDLIAVLKDYSKQTSIKEMLNKIVL